MRVTFATLRASEVVSFGVMYLSAVLKQAGHSVRLVAADDAAELSAQLRRCPPEVVAFSVTTGLHGTYLAWARAAKRALNVITLFGGPHPTFFPEMIRQPEVDGIVMGEGEHSLPELLDAFQARDGRVVAGAHYRLDGEVICGPLRPPPQDLDELPLPDRALYFDRDRHHRTFPVRSLLASRGCPYRCSYCFNGTLLDMYRGQSKVVRLRSPAAVIDEIHTLRRQWPTDKLWFLDANFAVSHDWVAELCDRLARQVKLPFYCKVRPNVVDDRLAQTLARGGCTGVGMGIECGDDELREQVLQRNVSRAQILEACRKLRSRGIAVMSFNMVGLPGETYRMARSTVDLNVEAGVDYAMTMVFQPYPRTRLTDYAIEQGLFDGDFDLLEDNYYASTPLRQLRDGDADRVENLQRLFALAVEFPDVRRVLDRLVERRASRLYAKLFELWHRHCFYRRFYDVPLYRPRVMARQVWADVVGVGASLLDRTRTD
ncbi:MAG: B12-binding domain-containing radical SAM protein [Deltaproteobacteria bacterium]|nr:B12-binding domain-containing radical SAM protein [Deltaproteobacteria bacterium]